MREDDVLPAPADVLLTDGRIGTIRVMAPADLAAVSALHEQVSDESLRLRFFGVGRAAPRAYLEHLRSSPSTFALVAEVAGEVVALATAEPIGSGVVEVSFLVADRYAGAGLGSLLLEHVAAWARRRGVRRLTAEVLPENRGMLQVFADAGLGAERHEAAGVVTVELDPAETEEFLAVADVRDARSEARSLAPLLSPSSVAVIGARRNGTGVGAAILRSIRAGGFTGRLVVVHPAGGAVVGVPAARSLAELEEPVDLVVVAVPAETAPEALREAGRAGARAAVVVSSGFEELGDRGRQLQREMTHVARRHSIRLVGPNCLGVVVNDPAVRLNATFHEVLPPAGGLAVASQSGGVGIVLMDLARRTGLGVRSFVSLGNKADVSSNDLLAAWREDPEVTAAALYLESFGNAVKFARLARGFSEAKPLLAVVGGRSTGGRRAGASHTAATASPAVGVDALFAQAGVIRCEGTEELVETALVLAEPGRPAGRRLGIVSNAGGLGVLAADAADASGLEVPRLSDALASRVAGHVEGTAGTRNPVDTGAGAGEERLAAAAAELLASDEVDAVLAVLVATGLADASATLRHLVAARAAVPGKPLVLVPLGDVALPAGGTPGIPRLPSVGAAVRALARVVRYEEWRAVPRGSPTPPEPDVGREARAVAEELLGPGGDRFLGPEEQQRLLAPYGVELLGTVVRGPEAAASAAGTVDGPVVVKVADPTVVHRTERGLVRVALAGRAEVVAAVRQFESILGASPVTVLVQPVVTGPELALGVARDPVFGPLVMVAAGGVATEVWDDRVFLMPPVTVRDARRALRSLRIWPLLEGFRGSPRVDLEAVERLVLVVGRLARDVPTLAELDLNPVIVNTGGAVLVDVVLRLATDTEADLHAARQLRPVR